MPSPAPKIPSASGPGRANPRASEVLRSAVDLFVLAATHERAEIRAFSDLLGGLLPDASAADRAHVAAKLAHRADTPPVIARILALDAVEIARPMVLRSPVLTSADLVRIMRCGPGHVDLVAERLDLTADVVLALGRSFDADLPARAFAATDPAAAAALDELRVEALVTGASRRRPIGDADDEAELALQRALDELAAELAAEDAGAARADILGRTEPAEAGEIEAEEALRSALDRLAGELDVEARAVEAEEAAARALRRAAPDVAGDIDVFLSRDPAGRWRFIQEHSTSIALSTPPPRRRRSDDPSVIGARLFSALVAGEEERFAEEIGSASRLDRAVVDRILTDRHGEALAVALAALGVDERTATSILLLHSGERATLSHMQDLSAMAGRIGWRTAENILQVWRGGRGLGRTETARIVDPAERRGGARQDAVGGERAASAADGDRLRGNER